MKLIRLAAVISAIALTFAISGCNGKANEGEGKAKYIFLFIGDGMGNSHVAATESYLSYKAGKLGGEQPTMTQFPYLGLATTYSASHNITCSSAAGTAIACGKKTNNGMVGIDPEGNRLESIAVTLKNEGYKVGIMSSVPINHATPASFYGHNESRSAYYSISKEIPASGFEFFGGAGFLGFNGDDGNEEDTDVYLENNGYKVCYGSEEFYSAADSCDRIIVCQEGNRKESAGNYVSDGSEPEEIALAMMVEMAIEYLGDEKPFFIMCEGGAIDWSAHDNKTMSTVNETMEFDEAIKVAYNFYLEHADETIIVVTADHETGGISLGSRMGSSNIDWEALEAQWNESGQKSSLDGKANWELNEKSSIGWTTFGHTGAPVPVYAIGKGAERFCGRLDNTEIKGKILGE